jgi:membrane-bound metal-dependent hydrolase YbcI (DUF457 family)
MATPLAHALAGIMCTNFLCMARPKMRLWSKPSVLVLAAALACAPDLDIAVGLLLTGDPSTYHSRATHSLVFALLVGVITLLVLRASARWVGERGRGAGWREASLPLAMLSTIATASHGVIDTLTGPAPGHSTSYGTLLFWPFSGERVRLPFTVFRGVRHGDLSVWFSWRNMQTLLVELVTFTPLTLLTFWACRRRCASHS